ncbi:MAG: 3-(3-hydroxy-phenyl)propanoic acid hydroxylase [Nocardia sp.]|nr:hypothetical protein [Nocardia sp.]MCU1645554.1 3-(3-hydroxy-phenyl)propanoic acid hydroxylase [Nocardia sp.]
MGGDAGTGGAAGGAVLLGSAAAVLLTTGYGDPAGPLNSSGYRPSAAVGARLPHAWLADGHSTFDLIGPGPTLLSGKQLPEQLRREFGLSGTTALLVRPDGRIGACLYA